MVQAKLEAMSSMQGTPTRCWKLIPSQAQIQKNAGCNHITCTSCGHQFCWLCNGKYTPNHYDIFNLMGCPGLQFEGTDKPTSQFGRTIKRRAMVGTGMVVGGACALPVAVAGATIGGVVVGGRAIGNGLGSVVRKTTRKGKKKKKETFALDSK